MIKQWFKNITEMINYIHTVNPISLNRCISIIQSMGLLLINIFTAKGYVLMVS